MGGLGGQHERPGLFAGGGILSGLLNVGGVDDSDAEWLEAQKVLDIKSQEMRDAVREHDGNESGVMNLPTGDIGRNHETQPLVKDRRRVRQERKEQAQTAHQAFCVSGSQPQTVVGNRARGAAPELRVVLRRGVQWFAAASQGA